MAAATREQVMNALFARLLASTTITDAFPTISRRFLMWEQVAQAVMSGNPPLYQPALYLYDGVGFGGGRDHYEPRTRSLPAIVTMHRTIVFYAQIPGGGTPQGPDSTTPGGTVFHPLIEDIISVVTAPDDAATNANTLGGLVSHCWISGEGHIITGEIDGQGQGMATLPIELMLYPS